jgi:N-acetyl-anhydromuramyl-L-alanine amidase AmpD
MTTMRQIHEIIVHCSDTRADMFVDAAMIRRWHTDPPPQGRGWSDIGYHYVILRDGSVQTGRPLYRVGAHVRGHNQFSVGICLVGGRGPDGKGEANFTPEQYDALHGLITRLMDEFGRLHVCGHHDYDPGKECPCFDAIKWWANNKGVA